VYFLGLAAALIALTITVLTVPDASVAEVLAPVMAVIGTFTGHAAGHASALKAVREGRSHSEQD
jgi:hypothetical protein